MTWPIALVLGGAKTVWRDLEYAQTLTEGLDTIIVASNYAGLHYPARIDAWPTLHHEAFTPWREERAAAGGNTDYRAFIHARHWACSGCEIVPERWSGSSGLYAAQVALEAMDAVGVILCGVPMDAEAGHIIRPGLWSDTDRYRPGFLKAKAEGAAIRSMSGWTADVLGQPNRHWLRSLGAMGVHAGPDYLPEEAIVMHVRFLADYDYTPTEEQRVTTAYKAGWSGTVRRECGDDAVRVGKAVEVKTPRRRKADD